MFQPALTCCNFAAKTDRAPGDKFGDGFSEVEILIVMSSLTSLELLVQ